MVSKAEMEYYEMDTLTSPFAPSPLIFPVLSRISIKISFQKRKKKKVEKVRKILFLFSLKFH